MAASIPPNVKSGSSYLKACPSAQSRHVGWWLCPSGRDPQEGAPCGNRGNPVDGVSSRGPDRRSVLQFYFVRLPRPPLSAPLRGEPSLSQPSLSQPPPRPPGERGLKPSLFLSFFQTNHSLFSRRTGGEAGRRGPG